MNLLVANRSEIAVRIIRAAAELGIRTVAVFSEDDIHALHTRKADEAHALRGVGVSAYMDAEQILAAARACGCDAIHPGYGFLSENVGFARRCDEEGITFAGPRAKILEMFGDKAQARALAESCGVPLLPGTQGAVSLDQAKEFLSSLGDGGAMMIKAVAGGGGRGMRAVFGPEEVAEAYTRCRSEALQALGNGDVYVEQLMPRARHIEVQVIGDGSGAVSHLGERECSVQRRHQKLVEIAPCPGLPPGLRTRITADAVRMAEAVQFDNIGTFEFLVDSEAMQDDAAYAFIEVNPRLQVEHTVTEEVTGLDLVKIQLQLAAESSLGDLGLVQAEVPVPRAIGSRGAYGYLRLCRLSYES
jgi:pyruvate carboxylase